MNFYEYVKTRIARDNPRGDFITEAKQDDLLGKVIINEYKDLEDHLIYNHNLTPYSGVWKPARQVFNEWKRYKRKNKL